MVFPRCLLGSKPIVATLIIIASMCDSIISFRSSFWSRFQRYARDARPNREHLFEKKLKVILNFENGWNLSEELSFHRVSAASSSQCVTSIWNSHILNSNSLIIWEYGSRWNPLYMNFCLDLKRILDIAVSYCRNKRFVL
jgi:hypothetical protein